MMERSRVVIAMAPRLDPEMRVADSVTIDDLPDNCLASIFRSLKSIDDRIQCSVVCRRWFKIEGQNRHRLCLIPNQSISLCSILSIFSRFDSVTDFVLDCRSLSIGDEDLPLISQRCPNLTSFAIFSSYITDAGLEAFARNYKGLKKFSCRDCLVGYKGLNALMHHCAALEQLSVTNLLESGASVSSLKAVFLQDIVFFGAKNLTTLKLVRCDGNWDEVLHALVDRNPGLVEVHLENLEISDIGLKAISKCSSLETLHIVKNWKCSDAGVVAVAEGCKLLRVLHIDGWMARRIRDEGLMAVAECCPNLEEVILIGMNLNKVSFEMLTSNCRSLERLAYSPKSKKAEKDIYDITADLLPGDTYLGFLSGFFGVHCWIKGNLNPIWRDRFWKFWAD